MDLTSGHSVKTHRLHVNVNNWVVRCHRGTHMSLVTGAGYGFKSHTIHHMQELIDKYKAQIKELTDKYIKDYPGRTDKEILNDWCEFTDEWVGRRSAFEEVVRDLENLNAK